MADIFGLMAKVLAECPSIDKSERNQGQNFNFRGIDSILDRLNPILSRHGVFFVPTVEELRTEGRSMKSGGVMWVSYVHVSYRFYAPDGSSVGGSVWGEGADMGDKATSKALTMAEKAMLVQAFAIATREMDPDAESVEQTSTVTPIRREVPQDAVDRHPANLPAGAVLSQAARSAGCGDERTRRDVLQAVTGKRTSKDLPAAGVQAAIAAFKAIETKQAELRYDEDGQPIVVSLPTNS